MNYAETSVQAKTYDECIERAMKQLRDFYGVRDFKIVRTSARAVGSVAGDVLTWDCIIETEMKP